MIKAVIYDLDGTLLDTVEDIALAHNFALRSLGFPEHPLEDFNGIIGGGIMEAIKRAAPEGTPPESLERLNGIYQEYYPQNCTVRTRPYPGIEQAVRQLAETGAVQAVLTNKTEPTAKRMVEHFFSWADFKFVWGNDKTRKLKPDPEAGIAACALLGLKPEEIAYVGDSDVDMLFAAATGILPVGACWGYRGREELKNAGGKLLPATPADMAELLQGLLK